MSLERTDRGSVAGVRPSAIDELVARTLLLLAFQVDVAVVTELLGVTDDRKALLVGVASVQKCGHGLSSGSGRRPRSMASVELRSACLRSERCVAVATDLL